MAEESGVPPAALVEMPEVFPDLEYVVEAFSALTSSRQVGFGLAPIPLTEIKTYVEMFDIPDDLDTFLRLLRALDNEYLETLDRKLKQNGNKSQARN